MRMENKVRGSTDRSGEYASSGTAAAAAAVAATAAAVGRPTPHTYRNTYEYQPSRQHRPVPVPARMTLMASASASASASVSGFAAAVHADFPGRVHQCFHMFACRRRRRTPSSHHIDETGTHVEVNVKSEREEERLYLNQTDLELALSALFGYRPSPAEVRRLLQREREREKQQMSESETETESETDAAQVYLDLAAWSRVAEDRARFVDEDEELRQMFAAFDISQRGFITADDLRAIFTEISQLNHYNQFDMGGRGVDKSNGSSNNNIQASAECKGGANNNSSDEKKGKEMQQERGLGAGAGIGVRDSVIEEIFAMADVRGDGRVGFREFQRIMTMTRQ